MHDKHAGHNPEAFRRRFWLTLVLTVPVVASSEMVMGWFGYELSRVAWVGPVLGTFIYLWGGWPSWRRPREIRDRAPGMMLLIAMAITVAWSRRWRRAWVVRPRVLVGARRVVTIMLLGHWQEMKAIGQAQGALRPRSPRCCPTTRRSSTLTVSGWQRSDLHVGDVVLVRPGGRVPADGRIVEGQAELDESMITGESRPVPKGPGERVVAGTVSTDTAIRVRVEAVGEDTALAGIQRLVAEAQSSRSHAQVLADRFAAVLFYVATGSGHRHVRGVGGDESARRWSAQHR